MYFEGVEKLLARLAVPDIKSTTKAGLMKQLADIDPESKIRDYLAGRGARPVLAALRGKDAQR
jgi:hypothetical protein